MNDKPLTFLGFPVYLTEAVPEDEILIMPPRRERETIQEWGKRCAIVKVDPGKTYPENLEHLTDALYNMEDI